MRSPNYPQISLKEAVRILKVLLRSSEHGTFGGQAVANYLGHQTVNGTIVAALSAMKKYGLITQDDKETYAFTLNGVTMLSSDCDPATFALMIEEAAIAPEIFRRVYEKFLGTTASPSAIANFLHENHFSNTAVTKLVSAYIETREFVGETKRELEVAKRLARNSTGATGVTSSPGSSSVQDADDWRIFSKSVGPAPLAPGVAVFTPTSVGLATDNKFRRFADRRSTDAIATIQAYLNEPINSIDRVLQTANLLRTTNVQAENTSREWMTGVLGPETSYRLLLTGPIDAKQVAVLRSLLETQLAAYEAALERQRLSIEASKAASVAQESKPHQSSNE